MSLMRVLIIFVTLVFSVNGLAEECDLNSNPSPGDFDKFRSEAVNPYVPPMAHIDEMEKLYRVIYSKENFLKKLLKQHFDKKITSKQFASLFKDHLVKQGIDVSKMSEKQLEDFINMNIKYLFRLHMSSLASSVLYQVFTGLIITIPLYADIPQIISPTTDGILYAAGISLALFGLMSFGSFKNNVYIHAFLSMITRSKLPCSHKKVLTYFAKNPEQQAIEYLRLKRAQPAIDVWEDLLELIIKDSILNSTLDALVLVCSPAPKEIKNKSKNRIEHIELD